jgi:ATP-dependent helicase/DNAse subunit B
MTDRGVLTIIDYKSSRRWELDKIAADYAYDMQFRFYMWNMWKHGHYFLSLDQHNAVRDGKFATQVVAVQVGSARDPKWHKCPPITMNEADMGEFEVLLDDEAEKIVAQHVLPDEVPMPVGKINNSCKYCDFKPLCYARFDHEVEAASAKFISKPYNPKHHNE